MTKIGEPRYNIGDYQRFYTDSSKKDPNAADPVKAKQHFDDAVILSVAARQLHGKYANGTMNRTDMLKVVSQAYDEQQSEFGAKVCDAFERMEYWFQHEQKPAGFWEKVGGCLGMSSKIDLDKGYVYPTFGKSSYSRED